MEGATRSCPTDFSVAEDARKAAESKRTMRTESSTATGAGNTTKNQGVSPPAHVRIAWRVAVCLLLLAGSRHLAQAATSVCGPVSGTWTSNHSPYLVTCDVIVTSLAIQPGVEVRFQGPYVFEVDGILQAQGTSNNPIVFTNAAGVVGWNGIFFNECNSNSFLTYCQIYGSTNSGVRIQNTTPAIEYCVIAGNSSSQLSTGGGGLYATLNGGALVLDHCKITNNIAAPGGGVCIEGVGGKAELDGCLIAGNRVPIAQYPGGGIAFGVYGKSQSVDATLRNCEITNNYAAYIGGGIDVETGGSAGALSMFNCKVANNTAGSYGGGLFAEFYLTAQFVNCTFVGNSPEAINMWSQYDNAAFLTNSIVYSNNAGGQQLVGNVSAAYSDIQGGIHSGPGNISRNPVMNPVTLELLPGSPCIDAGNPHSSYNDVCLVPCGTSQGTVTNDMGAYGGPGACGWTSPCTPVIAAQPGDQSSCLAHSATFTVRATGTGSLSYQWYFNTNTLIFNATNASLTLTNLQGTNAGKYSVVVSSQYGSVASALAQLTLYDPYTELQAEWYFDAYMAAGLNIAGRPGATYVLKYTTDLRNTNWATWTSLATNTMGSSGWFFYLDEDSLDSPTRFYGTKLKP